MISAIPSVFKLYWILLVARSSTSFLAIVMLYETSWASTPVLEQEDHQFFLGKWPHSV